MSDGKPGSGGIFRVPRVIPVIDVMGGVVVRAVAGRRAEYRRVESRLTRSTDPVDVAESMLAATGATEVYVADLDAILGDGTMSSAVHSLVGPAVPDVGQRDVRHSRTYKLDTGIRPGSPIPHVPPHVQLVIGSETAGLLPAPALHAAYSVDILGNAVRGADGLDPFAVALHQHAAGYHTLILLDLSHVGTNRGCELTTLARSIRTACPDVELLVGGGIRDENDIARLGEAGVDGVLVASAIHDGRIT